MFVVFSFFCFVLFWVSLLCISFHLSTNRSLLLSTIPILIVSLLILVIGSVVDMGNVVHAAISTASVVVYFCCFVMGFGPIPNILCAEIFPTRVRGLCIAICALTFWIGDIIVTYSLPVMLKSVGLAGVFGMYAIVCVISWVFVYLKVPETKGMPLEVITEFFSVGAKQVAAGKSDWFSDLTDAKWEKFWHFVFTFYWFCLMISNFLLRVWKMVMSMFLFFCFCFNV